MNALHYFNCKVKNIGVTFDISLFSHPTANPLTNAVIIPLTYTENLTSSRLHYRHSSSHSFDPLTLGLWQNLWCYFLLCPYHSLKSVLSTAITGMLNSPDHFRSLLKLSIEFPTQFSWHHEALLWPARHTRSAFTLPLWLSLYSALFLLLQSHWSPPCSWVTTGILLPSDPCTYCVPGCSVPLRLCLNLTISKDFSG